MTQTHERQLWNNVASIGTSELHSTTLRQANERLTTMITPSQIVDPVRHVLLSAKTGKDNERKYLTAYQILDRLPIELRDRIIAERKIGGRGAGVTYAAPSVVSDAAEMIPNISIFYLDSRGVTVSIAGENITPSNEVCGLYRLP